MMKRHLIIILFMMIQTIGCFNHQITGFSIHLIRTEDTLLKIPKYELIVSDNSRIIARRVFENGKTILAEGELPKDFINATTVRVIRSVEQDSESSITGLIYFQRGSIIAEKYKNDGNRSHGVVPDGILIERYEDGNIRNIYIHKNGKRNGPAIGLYENGQIKLELFYVDGFPSGIGKRYFENGNLMAEWEIVNKKESFHREYDETGKLKTEARK